MASGVDYSRPLEMTYLSCPDPTDTLATVEEKMKAIDRVVAEGKSIAVHMGLLDGYTMDTAEDVEQAVIARELTPVENLLYTSWKDGSAFPGFDFERFTIDVTHDVAANTRYARIVEALSIVWRTDKATPGNAAYVSMYMQHLTPLLFAVMKIEKAKGESRWGFPRDPSAFDAVEAETLQKVTDIASKVMSQEVQRVRMLARSVVESKGILMARKRTLDTSTGNEVDDNATSPDTQQQQQQTPRIVGSRPLPPTPELTEQQASGVTTPTTPFPAMNKRATQTSEATYQVPQRKFMKTTVGDDPALESSAGISSGSTPAQGITTDKARKETPNVSSQQRHSRQRVYYGSPLSSNSNTVPVPTPATPTMNRAPQSSGSASTPNTARPKRNYKKPRVSDADEYEDGD